MNMDMLSRVFDMIQRVGGMEQVGQLMVIVYGVICVFGLMNCILGYRILRFWMMIFGFLIGAGGGFAATYISGVQDKMVIVGAMAGLGIVLAIVSFLIYRAGIFVLGFGIGISLSIYLVHPTSSFSFFLCILIGVGLGVLAMRYAKGVIIIGTSVLGGVLAGISIAQIGGLAQFPYGIGMAAGIALLGMLIQFAINKDHYDEEEDEEEPYEDTDKRIRKKNASNSQEYDSKYNREDLYKNPSDRRSESRIRNTDSDERYSRRNTGRNKEYSDRKKSAEEKKTVLRTTEEVREAALAPAEERHRKETVPRIEDEVAQAEIILLIQEEAKAVIRLETADRAAEDPVIMIRSQKIVTFLIMMMFMKNLWIHMMILKDASREKDRWTLKIWQIMMI